MHCDIAIKRDGHLRTRADMKCLVHFWSVGSRGVYGNATRQQQPLFRQGLLENYWLHSCEVKSSKVLEDVNRI